MKIKHLMEALQLQDPELPVVLICFHGQELVEVTGQGLSYVKDLNEHFLEEVGEESGSPVYVLEAY